MGASDRKGAGGPAGWAWKEVGAQGHTCQTPSTRSRNYENKKTYAKGAGPTAVVTME